jgi:hypothetical protein
MATGAESQNSPKALNKFNKENAKQERGKGSNQRTSSKAESKNSNPNRKGKSENQMINPNKEKGKSEQQVKNHEEKSCSITATRNDNSDPGFSIESTRRHDEPSNKDNIENKPDKVKKQPLTSETNSKEEHDQQNIPSSGACDGSSVTPKNDNGPLPSTADIASDPKEKTKIQKTVVSKAEIILNDRQDGKYNVARGQDMKPIAVIHPRNDHGQPSTPDDDTKLTDSPYPEKNSAQEANGNQDTKESTIKYKEIPKKAKVIYVESKDISNNMKTNQTNQHKTLDPSEVPQKKEPCELQSKCKHESMKAAALDKTADDQVNEKKKSNKQSTEIEQKKYDTASSPKIDFDLISEQDSDDENGKRKRKRKRPFRHYFACASKKKKKGKKEKDKKDKEKKRNGKKNKKSK